MKSAMAGSSGLIFPRGHVHLSQVSRKHFPPPCILHGAGLPFRMTLHEVNWCQFLVPGLLPDTASSLMDTLYYHC